MKKQDFLRKLLKWSWFGKGDGKLALPPIQLH